MVGELGFGTGLNIAALLHLWRRARPSNARLHVFSVEGFPLGIDEARRALARWPEIAEASAALLAAWPAATPGFHRLDLPEFHAVVDLAIGPVDWALENWSGQADAWFLDGFSPALNPEMWSDTVLAAVVARSAADARLATFTVAGSVRRALASQGLDVAKRPGHGRKRERLEARRTGTASAPRKPRVAVIGAGIAGASVARALADQGVKALVLDAAGAGAGASGFPAALVTPRLDAGDAQIAALFAQALERANALYVRAGAVVSRGVVQLPGRPRDLDRFGKIAAQPWWRGGAMSMLSADAVAQRLKDAPGPALWMADALTVRPQTALDAWLGDAPRQADVSRLVPEGAEWRLEDEDGRAVAVVDCVVLTGGWGNARLAPELGLSAVRGQADWASGIDAPSTAWGGYVAPSPQGLVFGATHDRDADEATASEADRDRNLATLAQRLPGLARRVQGASLHSRAAVRAVTPDRLPLCGALPARGLFTLAGLGSRGFCAAPLLGEHLAALICDAPSPLPAELSRRLLPERAGLTRVDSDEADWRDAKKGRTVPSGDA